MSKQDWRSLFENLNGYASENDTSCGVRSEVYGEILISKFGTGKVFTLSGGVKFMRKFKRDFHCKARPDGSLSVDERVMDAVANWLMAACGEDAESVALKQRKSTYAKNCADELARLKGSGATEVESAVKLRVGQALLRKALLKERRRCEISGVGDSELLIVSHIKDWSESDDTERLDTENVLLLAANWDALFDKFYISFEPETGKMIKSQRIDDAALAKFGVPSDWRESVRVDVSGARRRKYLNWHNERMEQLDQAVQ